MSHETLENLSALIDGELPSADAERARAHAASCAECRAAMAKLEGASAAFKRSGEQPVPAGLAVRAKARAADRLPFTLRLGMAAAFGMILLLLSGTVLKTFMPTLFNNIQQMITGAAGQMGSGGGN